MLRRLKRAPLHCVLLWVMLVLMTPFLIGFSTPKRILIKYDGKEKEISTTFTAARAILEEAKIKLNKGDVWEFEEGHKELKDGCVLHVVRAHSFQVVYKGQTTKYRSTKKTVAEALKSFGVRHKGDRIYPHGHTKLKEGMTIYVLDKKEHMHLEDAEAELVTTYIDDKRLAAGAEVVEKHGKPAKFKIVSKMVKQPDGSHKTIEVGRVELEPGENRVIRRGVAKSVKTSRGYQRYAKKLICEATAYYEPGGLTASGTRTRYGVIATDPRFIPLGTKMYIPGYGFAVAEDTGGAIKGHVIDLYLNSEAECIQWGRRNVEVYILED